MATAPARGLEVSLRYILEHLLLQRQLGYQSFQPGVPFSNAFSPLACSTFRPPYSFRRRFVPLHWHLIRPPP